MFYSADRVLVGILNNQRDFEIARDEGWYRIPAKTAPESAKEASVLAFYLTRAFGPDKWSIRWYAAVRGHELVRRHDLLPLQPDHPRANDPYYKLQVGPLIELEVPIPSLRWRRITFIETSWDRFTAAEEVNDLYSSGADGMFVTLKEADLYPEREFLLREKDVEYTADLAIPCRKGTLAIAITDRPSPTGALRHPGIDSVLREVDRPGGPLPVRGEGSTT